MSLLKRWGVYALAFPLLFSACKKDNPVEVHENSAPTIRNITVNPSNPFTDEEVRLGCVSDDPDLEYGDKLSYSWSCSNGEIDNAFNKNITWTTPKEEGEYSISVRVEDKKGEYDTESKKLEVISQFDTLEVSEDSYVNNMFPNHSYSINDGLRLTNYEGNLTYPYLRFELDKNINVNREAESASLILNVIGYMRETNNFSFYAYNVLGSWNALNLDWENQPNIDPVPKSYSGRINTPLDDLLFINVDITDIFNEWMRDPSKNYGICLKPSQEREGMIAFSSFYTLNFEGFIPSRIAIKFDH